ncbi:hypothetical protein JCM10212_002284 [Sporobolomyces blumeae]
MTSPPAAAASLLSPPYALRLPTELWFIILGQLGYESLRKAARICKTVQRYTQDPTFDLVLFRRSTLSAKHTEADKLTLHPFLREVECTFTRLADARFTDDDLFPTSPLDCPATMSEYATSPASTVITIDHLVGNPFSVKALGGVTVRDVLEGIAKFLSRVDPNSRCTRGCRACGTPGLTWQEALEAECWGGWGLVQGVGGNCAWLVADNEVLLDVAADLHRTY